MMKSDCCGNVLISVSNKDYFYLACARKEAQGKGTSLRKDTETEGERVSEPLVSSTR